MLVAIKTDNILAPVRGVFCTLSLRRSNDHGNPVQSGEYHINWIASLITHANIICAGPDYARNDKGVIKFQVNGRRNPDTLSHSCHCEGARPRGNPVIKRQKGIIRLDCFGTPVPRNDRGRMHPHRKINPAGWRDCVTPIPGFMSF